jgi:hypothetical protein
MNFSNSNYARKLWEENILPGWRHSERLQGQRFLGSLDIDKENSDALLRIVGDNLRSHLRRERNITYTSLCNSFDVRENWIRVITAALSEYAYYYSSSEQGFWEGFCNCQLIKIPYSQGVEKTLREISRKGTELLGLVKAKRRRGNAHVSTLWLQSGIPQKNLSHFAELVQGIANEYGWWELAHTSERLLSQELLEFCQEKHPQWGTLIGFLRISCSDIEKVEPISGQLVQGIATVALELERNNESPDILRNVNQRENTLRNYYLPKHFFLRDWDNLIQVLTQTKHHRISHRKIIKSRKKALSLVLDVFDTGNIQLVLPQQNLREPNWSRLLGGYCHISVSSHTIWEGTIPRSNSDFLEVPERIIDIKSIEKQWSLRLLAHDKSELVAWHQEGITDVLPCLLFDANIGTHISLDATNPVISKTNEIICFIPRDVKLELNSEIDILSSYVPCSISGWYGQHIQLLSHNSEIALIKSGQCPPIRIKWQISDNKHPVLRGLKIKGRKDVYLEIPTFWHPPTSQSPSFNISVENLIKQEMVSRTSVDILVSDRWQSISLEQMIKGSGKYQVRFWNEEQRYSYNFELKSQHLITEALNPDTLQVFKGKGEIIESLPIQCDRLEQFWAEIIIIQGLWTLEKITLTLSNGDDKVSCLVHADKSGTVAISLSTFYGKLPDSDWYALDYQRSSMAEQRLVELLPTQPISCTWASQAIHLSELQVNQNYSLICWNLLTPNHEPERIRVQNQEQDISTVPLSLSAGIYHIQIQGRALQDLGCWCGDPNPTLPLLAEEDVDLENYCYTILGNESTEDFIAASRNLGIERQKIHLMISSLQSGSYYFPDWLNREHLIDKLAGFLSVYIPTSSIKIQDSEIISPPLIHQQKLPPRTPHQPIAAFFSKKQPEIWYLVQTKPKGNKTFQKHLQAICNREDENIGDVILKVEIPENISDYPVHVLVLLRNDQVFDIACEYFQRIDTFVKIERNRPSIDQVNRMLGRVN